MQRRARQDHCFLSVIQRVGIVTLSPTGESRVNRLAHYALTSAALHKAKTVATEHVQSALHTLVGLQGTYAALLTVEIPDDWTPEQALAVWELLNDLADRIWRRYEIQLVELIRNDIEHQHDENQLDLFDPDDTLPF